MTDSTPEKASSNPVSVEITTDPAVIKLIEYTKEKKSLSIE